MTEHETEILHVCTMSSVWKQLQYAQTEWTYYCYTKCLGNTYQNPSNNLLKHALILVEHFHHRL